MIRKLNRIIQDFLRPKRLTLGKKIWDKKEKKYNDIVKSGEIDMTQVNSILFLRYDGKIGDMIINTLVFKEIKREYPNIKIGVVARGGAKDIIKFNKNIDKIYEYSKGKEKELAEEISKESYDVLIDFSEVLRVNQMKFINLCKAKVNIGLNKEGWNLFDISYEKNQNEHISKMYEKILKILGIEIEKSNYEIAIPNEVRGKIESFICKDRRIIILNPYAASKHRSLNREKTVEICKKILKNKEITIYLIGEKSKEDEILSIINELGERVKYERLNGILEVSALIEKGDFIITPDTSIVHIGSTFNKPMIGIYRQDTGDNNSKVWGPNSEKAIQIYSKDIAKIGEESDINMFDIDELERKLKL